MSFASMNSQLERLGYQETGKCQDCCPDSDYMESLGMNDLRLPITGRCVELPSDGGTVDWNSADDPDGDPNEQGNDSQEAEQKVRHGCVEKCQDNS